MNQDNFIPRKFKNEKSTNSISFDEVIDNSTISIILGEPASGKTYQLETYKKQNPNSTFVELMFIDEEEDIDTNIEIVLLDSIDEALSKNDSDKTLSRELIKYIKKCQKINPNVKFVISCRYVEWKEIFEKKLEEIDKEFQVYSIEELNQEDIDLLLINNGVDKDDFWNFIKSNYLEQLLKNILMTIHLIDNFDGYKGRELKYVDIYKEIIEEHLLAETDNERRKQLKEITLEDMVKISSIVAIYMTLNRTRTISIEHINRLAKEFYQLDEIEITGKKLDIVFDTPLFSGNRNSTRFFHKSVQEYLTAYFIDFKQLDIETIKKIFAHNIGFYEEFEEVIIYLTNMELRFFNDFVAFDPFIFRRHPYLDRFQQEKLLLSVIDKLKNDEQRIYGKWKYLENTTIVTYPKITNLIEIIQENITLKDINLLTFTYIMKLFEFNKYDNQIEDYIFEILEQINDKKKYITYNFLKNYKFNFRLLEFLYENNLIETNNHTIHSFELRLFQSLYGINSKFNIESNCNYTNINFQKLLKLLEYIPPRELKDIVPYLKIEDINYWFEFIKNNKKEKYNPEYIVWLIYSLLKIKTVDITYIIEFMRKNYISIHHYIEEIPKINFENISDDFWNMFFKKNNVNSTAWELNDLLYFYRIELKDIKILSRKYPIENYCEAYINFRLKVDNIDDYLMNNKIFKKYWDNLQENIKRKQEKWNNDSSYKKREKDNLLKYQNLLQNFSTRNDLYNIVNYAKHFYRDDFIEKFKSDLGGRYTLFIEKSKNEFKNDDSYLKIKEKIMDSNNFDPTLFYKIFFTLLSQEEINKLISTKENYQKIFWHLYSNYNQLNKNYFITISHQFKDELVSLSIESIKLSLEQSNGKKISNFNGLFWVIELCKSLNIFHKKFLSELIEYISKIDIKIYKNSKDNLDKNSVLLILFLDEQKYFFIKQLMLNDLDNIYDYLKVLLQIDTTKAIKDFYNIYNAVPRYIFFESGCKDYNLLNPTIFHTYNKIYIEPHKIKLFIQYILSLKKNRNTLFEKLKSKDIEMILYDYYEFFKDYERPIGTSYGTSYYEDMNDFIFSNGLWQYLENSTEYIGFLERLTKSNITRLSIHSKYSLEKIYNLQLKNREFNNNYYKNILDNHRNKKDRFFNYEGLRDDLIKISLTETKNRNAIFKESEDETNDRFRNALHYKKYNVADQSRGGESSSGINAGERDLVICNEQGLDESVIEAFILKSLDSTVINKHYEKLVKRYDTNGNRVNFVLVYSKTKNFDELWKKYIEFDEFDNFVDTQDEYSQKNNVYVGISEYKRMKVYHLFINFYSHGEE